MTWLLVVATWVAVYAIIVFVHEFGHYLAAVWGGVRPRDVRIRMLTFPQHVVFRDGDKWVGPFDRARFHEVCTERFGIGGRYFLFTAGGLILQTVFVTAVCLILVAAGYRWHAWLFASMSGITYAIYLLIMDLPPTIRFRWPCGDTTGLWWLSKPGAVAVALGVIAVHAWLMVYTYGRMKGW